MRNIHILPTEKPSRLYEFGREYHLKIKPQENFRSHNIYITSDKTINQGDWHINLLTNEIEKASKNLSLNFKDTTDFGEGIREQYKKIVLTTDEDLINDGIQEIPEEFLHWYVDNPSCEEVEVNSDKIHVGWEPDYTFENIGIEGSKESYQTFYRIIIPNDQPDKDDFSSKLKEYFKNTPKDKVLEHWSESQEFDKIGPTMEEVIKPRRFFISYISKNNHFGDLSHGSFMYKNNKFPSKNQLIEDIKKDFIEIDSNYKIIITCISELSEEDYLNYIKENE